LYIDASGWNVESIPDGWVWQDIGNYYGAGAEVLNWRENQFDVKLQSGSRIGDPVKIIGTIPILNTYKLLSVVTSAAKGSGDNAYAYFPVQRSEGIVRGTIPVNEREFIISASIPSGKDEFEAILTDSLADMFEKPGYLSSLTTFEKGGGTEKWIHTELSPSLDSIIYWFLKKSINLYGEALVKTFAYEKKGYGATDSGVNIVKDLWKQKGLDPGELNIYDGSGLSPLNRVTTHAQVEVLKFAKKQNWFPYFYNALPEFNNMKMKSGTINDVKGFCGYHTSKDGKAYIFSFIVNNYNGLSASIDNKMYTVLDILK
jgi:D-alanyl-D-alanine carboxypeptidase/D-alanyl-D-alanine-endopeptidase (penicillin-binding protein 4)